MKTKLLKYVRRNYRIIENCVGDQTIEYHNGIKWVNYSIYKNFFMVENRNKLSRCRTPMELFIMIIHLKYIQYSRKWQIDNFKKGEIKKIWYNN